MSEINENENKYDGVSRAAGGVSEEERRYAERVREIIRDRIAEELKLSGKRKQDILEQRKYFSDYFAELKDDEKKDLLDNEALDTRQYLKSRALITRLARQEQDPYFAGFDFEFDGDPDDVLKGYISLQTLRDPETDEIVVFDWRAPVCSLYYESEPGDAHFDTPNGRQNGKLTGKRRYRFKKGKLLKVTQVHMPSDDDMLSEALSRNAGEHMRVIVESLQKEQHRIVRDHIDGVTVISGCAGSGKTSVALHKAAYILYGFRDRMKDSGLAIISPNDTFSEYISTVLPDLGEENIRTYLQEDLLNEVLEDIGDYDYVSRLDEAEMIGEFGLDGGQAGGGALALCRKLKSSDEFRRLILKYADFLGKNIFDPAELTLTTDNEGKVSAETLYQMFYTVYSDLPLLRRNIEIRNELCRRYNITHDMNKEFILETLNGMLLDVSAPGLYREMFRNKAFAAECGTDLTPLSLRTDMFEDACAQAVLHMLLNEPVFEGSVFYLICDEAQDLSSIFLELLRRRFPGCNMLFVGDSDQAVFGNTGDFVERIKSIIPRRPFKRYVLGTNYRSTKEIVDFSSGILGLEPGTISSVRSGEAPEVLTLHAAGSKDGQAELKAAVKTLCEGALARGHESLAVLTRTRAEAKTLTLELKETLEAFPDLRVYFLPVYLAKGLEFDEVAVWSADNEYYRSPEGRLAYYTACTRALHRLVLLNTRTEA